MRIVKWKRSYVYCNSLSQKLEILDNDGEIMATRLKQHLGTTEQPGTTLPNSIALAIAAVME